MITSPTILPKNQDMIEHFQILGLHGRVNVDMPFSGRYNILLSENGRGKTTILNALHAVLRRDSAKLQKLDFHEISIKFLGAPETLHFRKQDLQYAWKSGAYDYLKKKLSPDDFSNVIKSVIEGSSHSRIMQSFRSRGVVVSSAAVQDLIEESEGAAASSRGTQFFSALGEYFNSEILYLPTYRRVEESLEGLCCTNAAPSAWYGKVW